VTWQAVERELGQSILRVYALTPKNVRFLKIHNVEGLLPYTFERQEKRQSKYLGRGRSTPDRPKQKVVTVRFQITAVVRQEDILAAQQKTLGWRAAAIGFARLPFLGGYRRRARSYFHSTPLPVMARMATHQGEMRWHFPPPLLPRFIPGKESKKVLGTIDFEKA